MCTAVSLVRGSHYFGRNLDLSYSYRETVTVTPRSFPFSFRMMGELPSHHAIIGMAFVQENYPLYYDAVNEKGLAMAGLMFADTACYHRPEEGKDNVSPFEFIPWILGQCAGLEEAKVLLSRLNLVSIDFSKELPLSKLHWIISDKTGSLTVESTKDGLMVYKNSAGVLTNEPAFPFQQNHLSLFRDLSVKEPAHPVFTKGSGAFGLPGDFTSPSRFVRAAFLRENLLTGETEEERINGFFKVLEGTAVPKGLVRLENGSSHYTVYSACCNTETGVYCYKTCENSRVTAVSLFAEDLDGKELVSYPLQTTPDFLRQN